MNKLNNIEPQRVFHYFEEICAIPHGSGNMDKIAEYCVNFAKKHGLRYEHDEANNVIIYKDGTKAGKPVILQGHIDMVCQKTPESNINFETDGLDICVEGDYISANGTTLGADNGIAVAMIFAILESDALVHPLIEAVFTTDEEIGMIGAGKLDCTKLSGKRMINIDSESFDLLTVSCAGGSDCKILMPVKRTKACGKKVSITLKGLKGGHSGVEIDKGRVNANVLAGRILNYAKKLCDFDIISINGGDKGNAITPVCNMELVVNETEEFISKIEDYFALVKKEISERERGVAISIRVEEEGNFDAIDKESKEKLIYVLLTAPNGVVEMSAEIENLVETSLNLGVLRTEEDKIVLHFALRSNKQTAMDFLEERLTLLASYNGCDVEVSGHYPPWEYKENSALQELYIKTYKEHFGKEPTVIAIHAGLECGMFASRIDDFDCISIGPDMYEIHTVNERLSVSSTKLIFELLVDILSKM